MSLCQRGCLPPHADASVGVGDLLQRLHDEAAARIAAAYAPRSSGPLGTAIRQFARFAASFPSRTLFRQPRYDDDGTASAWNEWTLILFAVWLARDPSTATGRKRRVRTIETYISLLKGYLNYNYSFELMARAPRLKGLLKDMERCETGFGRRKRRALRRRHLRQIWKDLPEARSLTPNAVNEHALLAVAWSVLARGGELAPADKVWSRWRHPTRADLQFHRSRSLGAHVVLWLRPLKKKKAADMVKIPQIIAEFDGGGSDAYAALRRLVEYDPIGNADPHLVPLFRRVEPQGHTRHLRVSDMRKLVRHRMSALGFENPSEWGAHSCRIGGATDLVSAGDASPILLQAKGRWGSDIGRIYARMTRRSQIAASRLMQRAHGRDLEEIFDDFTQPAF